MESRKGRNGGISVEIVCSIPAGKSLINSRLVRNRLKGREKKKMKREREREKTWTREEAGRTKCRVEERIFLHVFSSFLFHFLSLSKSRTMLAFVACLCRNGRERKSFIYFRSATLQWTFRIFLNDESTFSFRDVKI